MQEDEYPSNLEIEGDDIKYNKDVKRRKNLLKNCINGIEDVLSHFQNIKVDVCPPLGSLLSMPKF